MKLIPKRIQEQLPDLFTAWDGANTLMHVKLIQPWNNFTAYVAEFDGRDNCAGLIVGNTCYATLFPLSILANRRGPNGERVQCDESFSPTRLGELVEEATTRKRAQAQANRQTESVTYCVYLTNQRNNDREPPPVWTTNPVDEFNTLEEAQALADQFDGKRYRLMVTTKTTEPPPSCALNNETETAGPTLHTGEEITWWDDETDRMRSGVVDTINVPTDDGGWAPSIAVPWTSGYVNSQHGEVVRIVTVGGTEIRGPQVLQPPTLRLRVGDLVDWWDSGHVRTRRGTVTGIHPQWMDPGVDSIPWSQLFAVTADGFRDKTNVLVVEDLASVLSSSAPDGRASPKPRVHPLETEIYGRDLCRILKCGLAR